MIGFLRLSFYNIAAALFFPTLLFFGSLLLLALHFDNGPF
jgi:hypothetical protein